MLMRTAKGCHDREIGLDLMRYWYECVVVVVTHATFSATVFVLHVSCQIVVALRWVIFELVQFRCFDIDGSFICRTFQLYDAFM